MELVLDIRDIVAVVLPLQATPVQRGVPVLVHRPIQRPIVQRPEVVTSTALVDGVYHPVAEMYIIFIISYILAKNVNPLKHPNVKCKIVFQ